MEVCPAQLKLARVSLMPRATCYISDPRLGLWGFNARPQGRRWRCARRGWGRRA